MSGNRRVGGLQVAAQALGLRAALPAMLWVLPLDELLQALTPKAPPPTPASDALETIEKVTNLVTRRFRPTRTACLKRALMRYALLQRAGFDAGFVVGVRPGGSDGFEAHAWVTLDDTPIMELEPVDCRPTFVWPRG